MYLLFIPSGWPVDIPQGLTQEELDRWVRETFPGADQVVLMDRGAAQAIERRARECHARSNEQSRRECFEQRFHGNVRYSRQKFRQAASTIHPAIRSLIGNNCDPAPGTTANIFNVRGCYMQGVSFFAQQAQNLASGAGDNNFQRSTFREQMAAEMSSEPRPWYAAIFQRSCRSSQSYDCFIQLMERISYEMEQADDNMRASFQGLNYVSAYMYLCSRHEGGAGYCSESEGWIRESLLPESDGEVPYRPQRPRTLVRGFPSVYSSGENDDVNHGILQACVFGYHAKSDSERNWSEGRVCSAIEGTDLAPFRGELAHIMERTTLTTYFDALRIEAVSRFLRAHYQLTGEPLNPVPAACEPFGNGIENFQNSTTPQMQANFSQTTSADYRRELQRAASRASDLVTEARRKEAVPRMIGNGDRYRELNPEYGPAQERLREIRAELLATYTAFPFLSAGHSPQSEPYNNVTFVHDIAAAETDSEIVAALGRAREQISHDLSESVRKFCDRDEIPWSQLVKLQEITGPVTERFPNFAFVQQCAREELDDWETSGVIATMFAGAGCVLGSIASAGTIGPLCAAGFTVLAAKHFNDARERAIWVGQCRAAGNAVCNEEDWMAAHAEYESALQELVLAGAFAALELPAALRLMRSAARFMNPAQLRGLTTELNAIRSIEDASVARGALATASEEAEAIARTNGMGRAIASEADDVALNFSRVPSEIRPQVQARVAELEAMGIPRSRIREVIPCLR